MVSWKVAFSALNGNMYDPVTNTLKFDDWSNKKPSVDGWLKLAEVQIVNEKGRIIQMIDSFNVPYVTMWDKISSLPLAIFQNGLANEVCFLSFEDYETLDWKGADHSFRNWIPDSLTLHTLYDDFYKPLSFIGPAEGQNTLMNRYFPASTPSLPTTPNQPNATIKFVPNGSYISSSSYWRFMEKRMEEWKYLSKMDSYYDSKHDFAYDSAVDSAYNSKCDSAKDSYFSKEDSA